VHPDWTRRGIGRAIFSFCERAARAAGVIAFECYSSLNAERFYAALNFKRVRELDIELQPHVFLRAVLMRRDL
jgi:predicted N-acetyltransferase YhbS